LTITQWWNQACKNLNIEGVDLYGGTKHSTVTVLGQVLTPEQIQRAVTGHVSNAFRRYMLPDKNEAIQGALAVQNIQAGVVNIWSPFQSGIKKLSGWNFKGNDGVSDGT
jgi:hypothetical protein